MDIIQQLQDLKEWSQNRSRYERRMNFRNGQLVKKLPDGKFSVRSKYKADLGSWPDGTKKARTHYFDTEQEALDFKKEAKSQPIKSTESIDRVSKKRSEWAKKFYKDNIDNFKVSDYDKFTKKMANEWAKESKKGEYIDLQKRLRITDDMGLPLVRGETTLFDLKAPNKGQVETHGPSKAFYKRAFFKGKLETDKKLLNGVKDYMTWATTKGAEGQPAAYKATRKDWLRAGAKFMDKDVLYLLGEGYDQIKFGKGKGTFYDVMSEKFPKLFDKYHTKINLNQGTWEKNLKKVADLAGRDFNEVYNAIKNENKAVKALLGIETLPPDMVFGYSGEHLGGLKTAILNNRPEFANKVLDNVIATTRGRNTELGYKLLEKPKNRLVREFNIAQSSEGKKEIVRQINELQQTVDPGTTQWKITKGQLDFKPLLKQKTIEEKAAGYLDQKGVVKFLKAAGYRCAKSKGGQEDAACYLEDFKKQTKDIKSRKPGWQKKLSRARNLGKKTLLLGLGPLDIVIEGLFAQHGVASGHGKDQIWADSLLGIVIPQSLGGPKFSDEIRLDKVSKLGGKEYADALKNEQGFIDIIDQYEDVGKLPDNARGYDTSKYKEKLYKDLDKAADDFVNKQKYIKVPANARATDLDAEGNPLRPINLAPGTEVMDWTVNLNPDSNAAQNFRTANEKLQAMEAAKGQASGVPKVRLETQEAENKRKTRSIGEHPRGEDYWTEFFRNVRGWDPAWMGPQGTGYSFRQEGMDYFAGGGIAGVRRPNAIPPKSGPMPQGGGLSSQFNRVKKLQG